MVAQPCHSFTVAELAFEVEPRKPEIFALLPFMEKVYWPLGQNIAVIIVHSWPFPVDSYLPGGGYGLLFFTSNYIYLILESHSIWSAKLLSLCMPFRRLIHVIVYISAFLFIEWYFIMWMYDSLFIHCSVDRYLGCFQFLAITDKAVRNILVQVFLWLYVFISLWWNYWVIG